jgi:hypothetical protein
VREFYAALPKPVLVGLEATGSMFWFLRLLEELGIDRSHAWVARQQPRPGALFGLLAHRLQPVLHHHPHPHQLVPVGAGSGTGA